MSAERREEETMSEAERDREMERRREERASRRRVDIANERERRHRLAHSAAHDAMKEFDPAWHAALETWIANGGEMPRRGA